MREIVKGSTSQILELVLTDAAGSARTGLAYNTTGLQAYYSENHGAAVQIPLASMSVGAWVSGGFVEVDTNNMPGLYQLGLPDASLDTAGVLHVAVGGAAALLPVVREIVVAARDAAAETHLAKAMLANKRVHTVSTGVDVVMDDDGTTPLRTMTPVDDGDDTITVTPS